MRSQRLPDGRGRILLACLTAGPLQPQDRIASASPLDDLFESDDQVDSFTVVEHRINNEPIDLFTVVW
jgi:hypothetical protein